MDLTQIAEAGLGIAIAIIVLYWKRQDDKTHAKAWTNAREAEQIRADRFGRIIERNTEALHQVTQAVDTFRNAIRLENRIKSIEGRLPARGAAEREE